MLIQETWLSVYEAATVDDMYHTFIRILLSYFNITFPIKLVKIQNNTKAKWMSNEIYEAKETLNLLHELYQHDQISKQSYTKYKNWYSNFLLQEKAKYYEKQINNSNNKGKTIWGIINNENGKTRNRKQTFNGVSNENGDIITSPQLASELFNNYYVNMANRLVGAIPANENLQYVPANCNSIYISEVTQTEILEIISNLKNKYSSGEDNISNIMLKRISCFVVEPLTYIVNESLKNGILPSGLKTAVVKPLFKKGDPFLVQNHRPVSMLSSFSKVLEIAMLIRLVPFLETNNIISKDQHGYQKNKSTTTATFDFVRRILEFLDKGYIALGIFLDLSKAFDCVNHTTLLNKLEKLGVRGIAYNWFKSYLEDRCQRVCVTSNSLEYLSSNQTISFGVPQGSVLGPVLFLIYINDLQQYLNDDSVFITTYADDTNILIFHRNYDDLKTKADSVYQKLCNWFYTNSLILNRDKIHCILFRHSRNRNIYPNEVDITDVNIMFSKSLKFLGVHIDEYMNWREHVHVLCGKLSTVCYSLKELKKVVDTKTLMTAYYGHFYSLMTYGIILWGGSHMQEVFVIQKRAVRILNRLQVNQSCRGCFKTLNLLTAPAVYIYESLCYVHKHKNVFANNIREHKYETKHKNDFSYPLHRTTVLEKGCFYKCIQLYNLLPNHIKEISSISTFKKCIKEPLVKAEPYGVNEIDRTVFL